MQLAPQAASSARTGAAALQDSSPAKPLKRPSVCVAWKGPAARLVPALPWCAHQHTAGPGPPAQRAWGSGRGPTGLHPSLALAVSQPV